MTERVLVLAQDLIWADRLRRAVLAAGAEPVVVGTASAARAALADAGPRYVVVDLTARAYDPIDAIGLAVGAGAEVLAVGQHDDVPERKRALAAGARKVLAYRKLADDGPATIAAWLAAGRTDAATGR